MKELRTLLLLNDCISEDYSWRIKELSIFRNSILVTKDKAQQGMIRAGITLLYAHWEGFIKKCADLYYAFVSYQDCTIGELSNCFISIVLRSEIEYLQNSTKLKKHNEIVNTFFEKQSQKANFAFKSPIKTSNLRYDIFEDVCVMIGIDIIELHERYKITFDRNIEKTINEDLVDRRNFIAHGDYLPVTEKEYKTLYEVIVNGLLYTFKEIVMDAAQNNRFKRNKSNV